MLAAQVSLPEQFNALARRKGWQTVCDTGLVFDDADLASIVAICETARGSRPVTLRSELTARALGRHLRNLTFIEREQPATGPRRYRFGFLGSTLARRCGEQTGKYIDAVIPQPYLDCWLAGYDMIREWRAPVRFVSTVHSLKLDYLCTESVIVPLADASGAVTSYLLSAAFTARVR
jgi:hypothetical protein